jgi:adenylosuccinate synthase
VNRSNLPQIPRHVTVVIDLQFGSTGKGLIAGYLAERDEPDTVVTAWAANAGHTFVDAKGRKYIHTMLANGIVSPRLERIMIGPGSVLNLDNLEAEIQSCSDLMWNRFGERVQIFIHENAAVIDQRHVIEEAGPMTKIGSTKKGCGAAAIHKIRRNPDDMNTVAVWAHNTDHPLFKRDNVIVASVERYASELDKGRKILVEGAQGYSLSIHHGFYPYTTSRDVTTAQVLADCAVPLSKNWAELHVVGTARTYPIRVANRFDSEGKMVGTSGPCYDDQQETTFEALGQPVELTTVTKLPRRIFTFSEEQVAQAIRQCGVDEVFLNFVNYCTGQEAWRIMQLIQRHAPVNYLGRGPMVTDVEDVRV